MVGQNQDLQTILQEKPKDPSPQDLCEFLPWACNQLEFLYTVLFTKKFLSDVPTLKMKNKSRIKDLATSLTESFSGTTLKREKTKSVFDVPPDYRAVKVTAVYSNEHLLQLKFEKNKRVPRSALQLIALTLKYHTHLQYISVNSGLDPSCIYEISKFLLLANITDVCLDGSFVSEANYYILLEKPNALKQLSLSKCTINDKVVETIAAKLVYPLPASKTLSILNLSCNRITNVGAKYLAQALRSNRQLSYLNLASNMIDDEGAEDILSILMKFPLTKEEAFDAKRRLLEYLKKRQDIIYEIIDNLKTTVQSKRSKKKSKPLAAKRSKIDKQAGDSSKVDRELSDMYVDDGDDFYYAKAKTIAVDMIGDFKDPFKATVFKHDQFYCSGNNRLAYLNLAYNYISHRSINKLLAVLYHQNSLQRRPKGLVNVCVEGNPLPIKCSELTEINTILDIGLTNIDSRSFINKKRSTTAKNFNF